LKGKRYNKHITCPPSINQRVDCTEKSKKVLLYKASTKLGEKIRDAKGKI
jgi:hypothetical protein